MVSRVVSGVVAVGLGLSAACGGTASSGEGGAPSAALLVAASDYSSSVVCGATCASGVDLGKDPQLAASSGRVFFLARDNDLIFELDPATGAPIARTSVHDAGGHGASNPHDVAAAPDGSLFVTLYNVPRIVILQNGVQSGAIDLSSYDGDQNPQADAIRIVTIGGVPKAFVALERLDDRDRLQSKQASQMLRIDVATRAVEAAIDLAGRNPFNTMAEHDGALFLAEPGNFDADDDAFAGIERFETSTSTTRLLVAERELGGSVSEVVVADGCGVAIVAGPQPNVNPTSLVTFDPVTGRVLTTAHAPVLGPTPGYHLQGLAWRDGSLYVGDRRRSPDGYPVHVLDRKPGECAFVETAPPILVPQPPVALRAAKAR
jgi:hypothetical protein